MTDLTLSVIPILLGDGIPLFGRGSAAPGGARPLDLVECRSFPSGLVRLSYRAPGNGPQPTVFNH